MTTEEKYMTRCLQLARLGKGSVAPNPLVGAVLVNNGKIIGEGYHKKYGEPHAEVNCINSVMNENKRLIQTSTLFVSLEPCSHYGKTPPCTDLIIHTKIPKVVIGCRDIFKEVNGRGIQKLEDAGIEVITGVIKKECIQLNKRFFTFHEKKRPYIILKWAQSFDGKIGMPVPHSPGERVFVSNDYTNRLVHKWRTEEAAVLIGTNTALYDDPLLTARLWEGMNPVRLVIDLNLRIPIAHKLFDKEIRTIIFNTIKHEEDGNLIYYRLNKGESLEQILKVIYQMNIQSVLVEGGTALLQSFIDAALWDEARIICNTQLVIGKGIKAPELPTLVLQKSEKYSGNSVSYFKNASSN